MNTAHQQKLQANPERPSLDQKRAEVVAGAPAGVLRGTRIMKKPKPLKLKVELRVGRGVAARVVVSSAALYQRLGGKRYREFLKTLVRKPTPATGFDPADVEAFMRATTYLTHQKGG